MRFIFNLIFSVIFLSTIFGLLEFVFRVNAKFHPVLNEYETFIESQGFKPDNKQPNEKRIFIIGESAARGVPYTMEFSVSGLLQKLLDESNNLNIKIVNSAVPGRHSFYQKEEGGTLVRYKADGVVIYAGNNDARDFSNVMRDMPLALFEFKLFWNSEFYSFLKHKFFKMRKWVNKRAGHEVFVINYNQDDMWHWTDSYLRKKQQYLLNPELGLKRKMVAIEDYHKNLDDLTGYLLKHKANVYVCNLPVVHEAMPQIGDWSRKGYAFDQKVIFRNSEEETAWKQFFDQGKAALEKSEYYEAIKNFEEAKKLNGTYPMLFYDLGKAYAGMGDYSKAKVMYVKSKDLQIQSPGGDSYKTEALRTIASKYNLPFIDLQAALEEIATHGIVGMELFLDHCHPSSFGHKIIAARIMQSLCDTHTAQCPADVTWKFWLEKLMGELNEQNLAREYLLVAFYHFKGTQWNAQPDYKQAIEYLEKARAVMPENVNIYPLLAASYWNDGKKEKAVENLQYLKKLNLTEYQKTLVDFPYLAQIAS